MLLFIENIPRKNMNKAGKNGKYLGHHAFLKIKFIKYQIYNKNIGISMVHLIVLKAKFFKSLKLNQILYFIKIYVVLKKSLTL